MEYAGYPSIPFSAMVAKILTAKEVRDRPDAQAAVKKEADRQRRMGTWRDDEVREKKEVEEEYTE